MFCFFRDVLLSQAVQVGHHGKGPHFLLFPQVEGVVGMAFLGALAGETGMPGKLIGTIDMFDKYTFVEVPREYAKDVLHAMQNAKIKGKSIAIEPANQK